MNTFADASHTYATLSAYVIYTLIRYHFITFSIHIRLLPTLHSAYVYYIRLFHAALMFSFASSSFFFFMLMLTLIDITYMVIAGWQILLLHATPRFATLRHAA